MNPIIPRARARTVASRAAFFLAAAALVACSEPDHPAAPRVATQRTAHIVANPDVADWNTFDADVNVTFSGNPALANISDAESGVGYHIHRRLDASGTWVSDFDYGSYLPDAGDAPGSLDPPPITRAIGAAPCRTGVLYDATGAQVLPPTHGFEPIPPNSPDLVPPSPTTAAPTIPRASCGVFGSGARPHGMAPDSASREWIARYIATPANARQVRAELVATMGPPVPDRGHSHFSQHGGSHSLDVFFDDSAGVVDELRLHEDDGSSTTIHRTYDRQNRFRLLSREHVVTALDSGVLAFDITYANISISREN